MAPAAGLPLKVWRVLALQERSRVQAAASPCHMTTDFCWVVLYCRVLEEHGTRFRGFAEQALVHLSEPSMGGGLSVHDMPSVLIALATLQVRSPADLAVSALLVDN